MSFPANKEGVRVSVRSINSRLVLMIAAGFAATTPAVAEDSPPSGHEIIQRFVDVCGGREAYAKIRNRAVLAKVDLSDHGWEGELVELFVPPDYRRLIVVDSFDPIVTGLADGTPWRWNAAGERTAMDKALTADTKRHAQLNPCLDWETDSGEATVVGDATVDNDECYRVEIVPTDGSALFAFFSKKTGLLRRIDDQAANMFRYYDDYQKKDGVLIPHNVRIDAGMMMLHLDFVSIEQNVDLTKFDTEGLFQMFSKKRIDEMLGVPAFE